MQRLIPLVNRCLLNRKLILISCVLACAGCGGSSTAPVSGTVTLNGAPLPKATVTLQRSVGDIQDRLFRGVTDEQGKYSISSFRDSTPGVPPGSYRVMIGTVVVPPDANELTPLPKEIVPGGFRDGSQTLEVPPEGLTSADFVMKSR